ncbi:MAG: TRAP transporter small permease [Pseudomonadota bacterium]
MQTSDKFLNSTEQVLAALCITGFFTMFVLGVATVVFRFVIESSLSFPEELIRYLFIWVTALGSAIAYRRNAHAAIGIVVGQLPDVLKRLVILFATLASALFFSILVYQGALLTIRVMPQISPALEVSMAWVYAAVPAGGFFLLIFAIELFFKQLQTPASELETGGS